MVIPSIAVARNTLIAFIIAYSNELDVIIIPNHD